MSLSGKKVCSGVSICQLPRNTGWRRGGGRGKRKKSKGERFKLGDGRGLIYKFLGEGRRGEPVIERKRKSKRGGSVCEGSTRGDSSPIQVYHRDWGS